MIKLFSLKQKQQNEAAAASAASSSDGSKPGSGGSKITSAQIRLQKDLSELELPSTITLDIPNPDDILNFNINIRPDEGFYKGGSFHFTFKFKPAYPHEPPKVQCTQKIYHPNIDLDGNVCLNILREDWKPVLNLQSVVVGLQFLFLEPNPDDPLNKEAAQVLRQDRRLFEQNVKNAMNGGSVASIRFDNILQKQK